MKYPVFSPNNLSLLRMKYSLQKLEAAENEVPGILSKQLEPAENNVFSPKNFSLLRMKYSLQKTWACWEWSILLKKLEPAENEVL